MSDITIRSAKVNDCELILGFIQLLADYEKMSKDVQRCRGHGCRSGSNFIL